MTWQESVEKAVKRLAARSGTNVFTRQELIDSELNQIVEEVGSVGATPDYTLSRVLQELRDRDIIDFESPGVYRLRTSMVNEEGAEYRTLFNIPVSNISSNPHNPRIVFDPIELDELKGSIQKVGILVPVTVYKNTQSFPKTGYVLLDGERRWRCAKELGLETIPANVIDEPKDITQNILFMFNIHHYRREWELFPTALKLEQLIEAVGSDQESVLSNFTGVSRSTIRRCKALLWFPTKYRSVLMERNGKVSTDFFIEVYPIVRRLSQEDEYSYPTGVERLVDLLMQKFMEGKFVTDVKEFREIRRALAFWDKKNDLQEFKDRLESFLKDPQGDLAPFAVEDEKNIGALLKHIGYVLNILDTSSADAFSDVYVAEQLKLLSKKIKELLEEIE
jgi:ParB/RepB/Spo0J family partition protein